MKSHSFLRNSLGLFTLGASGLGLTASLHAQQVIMLDFGPTAASGAALTSSPYHTVNTSFTQSTWKQIQVADIAAGSVVNSDNTTATGVTVDLGMGVAGGSTLVLTNTPTGNGALGTQTNSGVYLGTSVGKDAIFGGAGSTAVGFEMGGLAAGTYDVYITARNTSLVAASVQNIYVGVTSSLGDFNYSGYATKSLSYANAGAGTTAWTENANYVKFSVSITSGDYLNLATLGGATGELRGFLNSVQIVSTGAIPEPSSAAAAAGAVALGCVAFGRRRRS
jgi:hypothetical protein